MTDDIVDRLRHFYGDPYIKRMHAEAALEIERLREAVVRYDRLVASRDAENERLQANVRSGTRELVQMASKLAEKDAENERLQAENKRLIQTCNLIENSARQTVLTLRELLTARPTVENTDG